MEFGRRVSEPCGAMERQPPSHVQQCWPHHEAKSSLCCCYTLSLLCSEYVMVS